MHSIQFSKIWGNMKYGVEILNFDHTIKHEISIFHVLTLLSMNSNDKLDIYIYL